MDINRFWESIEKDALSQDEAERQQRGIRIINHIAYSPATRIGEVKEVLAASSVQELKFRTLLLRVYGGIRW
jgi:hypothetical protein